MGTITWTIDGETIRMTVDPKGNRQFWKWNPGAAAWVLLPDDEVILPDGFGNLFGPEVKITSSNGGR